MKFDVINETNNVINFVKDYYKNNHLDGAIIGISGGKDSAVVASLMVEAIGKENVIGVTIPCHSNEEDMADAKLLSDFLGFRLINYDITNIFDSFKEELNKLGDFSIIDTKNSDINIKPRLRMSTLYYLCALYSGLYKKNYLVIGTSNKCEQYVGYFTKGGDSVHDIAPIADFTVSEVIKIGEYLKVPTKILYKTPSDGLSNQSDEEKLGVSYNDIEKYMNNPNSVDIEVSEKIAKLHNNSLHKFNIPTYRKNI